MKLQEFIATNARKVEKTTERNLRTNKDQQTAIIKYSEWRNEPEWGSHYESLDNGRQAVIE